MVRNTFSLPKKQRAISKENSAETTCILHTHEGRY